MNLDKPDPLGRFTQRRCGGSCGRFDAAQAGGFRKALQQPFDAQVIINPRPLDAVARAYGVAVLAFRLGGVQEGRIVRQGNGQRPSVHQLNRQRVGRCCDALDSKV